MRAGDRVPRTGRRFYVWHGTHVSGEGGSSRRDTLAPSIRADVGETSSSAGRPAEIIGWFEGCSKAIATHVIDENQDPHIGTLLECEPAPTTASVAFFLRRALRPTGREFALAVPLGMRTALQANRLDLWAH